MSRRIAPLGAALLAAGALGAPVAHAQTLQQMQQELGYDDIPDPDQDPSPPADDASDTDPADAPAPGEDGATLGRTRGAQLWVGLARAALATGQVAAAAKDRDAAPPPADPVAVAHAASRSGTAIPTWSTAVTTDVRGEVVMSGM